MTCSIVNPKSHKVLVHELNTELNLMSQSFKLEVEKHLFIYLINRLRASQGNIYNSGKTHNYQIREFMMKKICEQLFYVFGINQITNTLVADIALNITSLFFDEMSRPDAIALAKKIKSNVIESRKFLDTKIGELIFQQKI